MNPLNTRARTAVKGGREMHTVLSAKQKKYLLKQKAKEKRAKRHKRSAQDSIPYMEIYPDGICQTDTYTFNKCITFGDINYHLARKEDKAIAFGKWSDLLNYFDPCVSIEITCMNQYVNISDMEKSIDIPYQNDSFDDIREEYSEVLRQQLSKGNNGLQRKKYITFGITAENLKDARPRLERLETDIRNHLKAMGVSSRSLSGFERLKILYSTFNEETDEPFIFNYDLVERTGLSTKDFIAPTSFDFLDNRYFKTGKTIGAVSFLHIMATELTDDFLKNLLDMENSVTVSFHITPYDQTKAIKFIKSKVSDLDKSKIEEQKKAVRSGYDMDVLPSDLVLYGDGSKKLLADVQSHNERFFDLTVVILNTAKNKKALDRIIQRTSCFVQQNNCSLKRLDNRQEQGLMSAIPLGLNLVHTDRSMTTTAIAGFMPFTTEELFQKGEALYCGINAISNNMIMADRKLLKNPNGLILGTPGSGKSFSAKREMANAFLVTKDDIIICDPESEYAPLAELLKGQVIRISPSSRQYINPMDINLNYSEDENPVSLKADFILSLCELIVGSKTGLEPVEKTIIDRCVRLTYRKYLQDPTPQNMPILEDLYESILSQDEPEAKRIATALEIYVRGSLNVFNHRTNVDITNRLVCFDIKELGKQLKKIGMLVVQDQVWNKVTVNREKRKSTRYYIDEFHLLLKDEQTASYSVEIWKRFRKWGGIPTGITQNVKDLLSSREIENIFENSDYIYMLNQAGGDREILAQKLNISPDQLSFVTNSNEGEGLLFYGNTIIPFKDKFPKDTKLYRYMTTKLNEQERKDT